MSGQHDYEDAIIRHAVELIGEYRRGVRHPAETFGALLALRSVCAFESLEWQEVNRYLLEYCKTERAKEAELAMGRAS